MNQLTVVMRISCVFWYAPNTQKYAEIRMKYASIGRAARARAHRGRRPGGPGLVGPGPAAARAGRAQCCDAYIDSARCCDAYTAM